jgi:uncharacterized membrane protein
MAHIDNETKSGTSAKKVASPICAISGQETTLHRSLEERIRADHPELSADALISRAEIARYRALYVEELLKAEKGELSQLDRQVADSMATYETLAENTAEQFEDERSFGERLSDGLASFGGSWTFIILFCSAFAVWVAVNVVLPMSQRFDVYPYILLNLILSCIAALQAPVIMMSQKRLEAKDRMRSQNDYRVNLKAELEIRHLHEKMDHLISRQWQRLAEIQQLQIEIMEEMGRRKRG